MGGIAAGLMALGAVPSMAADAGAELPAVSVQGIRQAVVLCLVADGSAERLRLQRRLCEQVRDLAAERAPVPVSVIGFGDPVLARADVLGVLVHATIDRSGEEPVVVLSVRPHRAAAAATAFFGADPVSVPLDGDGTVPGLALAAALDQVLPWRMRARRSQP